MEPAINESTPVGLSEKSPSAPTRLAPRRLRLWLTGLTIAAAIVCLLGIPATLIAAGFVFFAADDPRTTIQDIWRLQAWVWGAAALFFALLGTGVVGGWLAYRRGQGRLSLGLSLVSAVPVVACLGGVAVLVLLNVSTLALGGLFNR